MSVSKYKTNAPQGPGLCLGAKQPVTEAAVCDCRLQTFGVVTGWTEYGLPHVPSSTAFVNKTYVYII